MESPLLKKLRARRDDDAEGWHLTLADMMTLILCFFVLVVSVSVVDSERFEEVASSMTQAMNPKKIEERGPQVTLKDIMADLRERFGDNARAVQLTKQSGAVAVNLHGPAFFELGSADLSLEAMAMLEDMAAILVGIPYSLVVEGHTDNIPIRADRNFTNWELSAMRACRVARFFIDQGFPRQRMRVVGLADTRPLAPNQDELGRPLPANQLKNRRVVILVTP